MVVERALLLGVPVNDDQGLDGDQQERLKVDVFPETCRPEPGVMSALGLLGGSYLELLRKPQLQVSKMT